MRSVIFNNLYDMDTVFNDSFTKMKPKEKKATPVLIDYGPDEVDMCTVFLDTQGAETALMRNFLCEKNLNKYTIQVRVESKDPIVYNPPQVPIPLFNYGNQPLNFDI